MTSFSAGSCLCFSGFRQNVLLFLDTQAFLLLAPGRLEFLNESRTSSTSHERPAGLLAPFHQEGRLEVEGLFMAILQTENHVVNKCLTGSQVKCVTTSWVSFLSSGLMYLFERSVKDTHFNKLAFGTCPSWGTLMSQPRRHLCRIPHAEASAHPKQDSTSNWALRRPLSTSKRGHIYDPWFLGMTLSNRHPRGTLRNSPTKL